MSILDFCPYPTLREVQKYTLLEIEKEWDNYDVFVLVMPTSAGKSAIAKTIADWIGNSRVIVPNNMLIDQFLVEFPNTSCRKGNEFYHTNESRNKAKKDFASSLVTMSTYHMHAMPVRGYSVWKKDPYCLVADEAHNLIGFQRDQHKKTIWRHKTNYPSLSDWPKFKQWAHGCGIKEIKNAVFSKNPTYVLQESTDSWKAGGYTHDGRKMKRGEEEELPILEIKPVKINNKGRQIWPKSVEKIVLMSATINRKDIEVLGLGKKRVRYIEGAHPILPANRPIIGDFIVSVNHKNFEEATKLLAEHIESTILPHHKMQKGIIHATYSQALILRKYLSSKRFMFHDKHDKKSQYQKFRDSKPYEGKILVASGMYEGIDLPDDLGRFQIITKIPWPSTADRAMRYFYENDPEWYAWQTLKDTIQACGRICRRPTDYGITYILDKSFEKIHTNSMVPKWFSEAYGVY